MPDFDVVAGGGRTAGVRVSARPAQAGRAGVEDDDWGRIELYADTTRRAMLVCAAAVGLYAEECMTELTLASRAGLPLRMAAGLPEGSHR